MGMCDQHTRTTVEPAAPVPLRGATASLGELPMATSSRSPPVPELRVDNRVRVHAMVVDAIVSENGSITRARPIRHRGCGSGGIRLPDGVPCSLQDPRVRQLPPFFLLRGGISPCLPCQPTRPCRGYRQACAFLRVDASHLQLNSWDKDAGRQQQDEASPGSVTTVGS